MYYESMPLYPSMAPENRGDACVRVPVFGAEQSGPGQPPFPERCRRVTIENPCRPGEFAEVLLSVDACGSLVVCVRRDPPCRARDRRPCPPRPCLPEPAPPRPCRDRGRLYGSWR